MSKARWMDLDEFRTAGYLQEVNRRFFHPLGLALAVETDDDGKVTGIAGVYDDRGDEEDWFFCDPGPDPEKVVFIDAELARRGPVRSQALGYVVQPPAPTLGDPTERQ